MQLERMAMCLPPNEAPQFYDVPEAVVAELNRRTQQTKKYWRLARQAEAAVDFLKRLAFEGGTIVSTASLTPDQVKMAWDENRIFVDQENLGYVLLPSPESAEE